MKLFITKSKRKNKKKYDLLDENKIIYCRSVIIDLKTILCTKILIEKIDI